MGAAHPDLIASGGAEMAFPADSVPALAKRDDVHQPGLITVPRWTSKSRNANSDIAATLI